jgi:hypothetical protein
LSERPGKCVPRAGGSSATAARNELKLTPIFRQIVIQIFSKTLNLCIMKMAASPVHADHPLKTRCFEAIQKQLEMECLGAWQLIK